MSLYIITVNNANTAAKKGILLHAVADTSLKGYPLVDNAFDVYGNPVTSSEILTFSRPRLKF